MRKSIFSNLCLSLAFISAYAGLQPSLGAGPVITKVDTKVTDVKATTKIDTTPKIVQDRTLPIHHHLHPKFADHTFNRNANRGTLGPANMNMHFVFPHLDPSQKGTHEFEHIRIIGKEVKKFGVVASAGHLKAEEEKNDKGDKSAKGDKKNRGERAEIASEGNQGIGDGPNVNVSQDGTPDDLKSNSAIHTIHMHDGTAFVAHNKALHVQTESGELRIAPKAAVFIMKMGKTLAVFNLADHKAGDVTMLTNGQKLPLTTGQQMLVTEKENDDFKKANLSNEIQVSNVKELGTYDKVRVYQAEFSPTSALDKLEDFHEMVNSKDPEERALADRILKSAAIVLTLRNGQ